MKKCDLLDLKDIRHIPRNDNMLIKLKSYLISPGCYVYTNEGCTALAIFIQVNEHCLEAHVESLPEARGFKLKKFLVESGKEAVLESGVDSVLNFVDMDDRALLLFSATFAERVGQINDKVLFVTERERYL